MNFIRPTVMVLSFMGFITLFFSSGYSNTKIDDGSVVFQDESIRIYSLDLVHNKPEILIGGLKIVAKGKYESYLAVYNMDTSQLSTVFEATPHPILTARMSPDSKKVITSSLSNGGVHVWDMDAKAIDYSYILPGSRTGSAAYSHDGTMLAFEVDEMVGVYNAGTRELIAGFQLPQHAYASGITFDNSGQNVIAAYTALGECGVIIGNIKTKKTTSHVKYESGTIFACALTLDGKKFAVGINQYEKATKKTIGTIYLLEAATGEQVREWVAKEATIYDLLFTSNGKYLLVAGGDTADVDEEAVLIDHDITMWNVDTGALVHTFRGHTTPVSNVIAYDQGSKILSSGGDGVRMWAIPNKYQD